MRKLASIQTVHNITPIENADHLELLHIQGWQVGATKNLYSVGERVIFIEPDSQISPSWGDGTTFGFLKGRNVRTSHEGRRDPVIKIMKFRGTFSQGLTVQMFPELAHLDEGTDVTDFFGITKWEAPEPANLSGLVKGNFPSFITKTDEERLQNCVNIIEREGLQDEHFTAALKYGPQTQHGGPTKKHCYSG